MIFTQMVAAGEEGSSKKYSAISLQHTDTDSHGGSPPGVLPGCGTRRYYDLLTHNLQSLLQPV